MFVGSAIQDDDAAGTFLVAAADKVDASGGGAAGIVGAVPRERVLARREDSVGERPQLATCDVVDADLRAARVGDPEADRRDAMAHDRVADPHEVHEVTATPPSRCIEHAHRRASGLANGPEHPVQHVVVVRESDRKSVV